MNIIEVTYRFAKPLYRRSATDYIIIHHEAGNGQTPQSIHAQQQASALAYVGIGEDFTGPLRPQLLVGDVAEITEDGVGVTLGIITQVKHTMGAKGFYTDFSVDSGGVVTTTDGKIRTKASGAYGYNRKQGFADIMRKVAGK